MRSKEKNMDLTSTENILDSEKKSSKKEKWADMVLCQDLVQVKMRNFPPF